MEKVVLLANERTIGTKGKLTDLRKNDRVPGVFYRRHEEPIVFDVTQKAIKPLVFTSNTHLISLEIDGREAQDCVIKDIQFDPVTDKVTHFDLYGLTKGEKIQLQVPVQLLGSAAGIKDGGILQHPLHKVEIECLPKDIPQHLEVNISNLKIGDAIHAGDLSYENIAILNAVDAVIVQVVPPKVEIATGEEEEAKEAAEPEVIGKGKPEEED
ncbi:MAG: 50S ribosomal protein L25 [Ignavibacteria bacterium CG_4_9_14_3_um_filter_36_18]|nr:MAG: 50S ribosomal protein L25 [Ignavibacteria bacterium CG_4_9_14_3_um_filter_36_18]